MSIQINNTNIQQEHIRQSSAAAAVQSSSTATRGRRLELLGDPLLKAARAHEMFAQSSTKRLETMATVMKSDIEDINNIRSEIEKIYAQHVGNTSPSDPNKKVDVRLSINASLILRKVDLSPYFPSGNRYGPESMNYSDLEQFRAIVLTGCDKLQSNVDIQQREFTSLADKITSSKNEFNNLRDKMHQIIRSVSGG